jgi:hypothetical protein
MAWYLSSGSEQESLAWVYMKKFVGFEVLTAVVMKSTIFSDITLCSSLKVNRRFGGIYRLQDGLSTDCTALYPRRWYS